MPTSSNEGGHSLSKHPHWIDVNTEVKTEHRDTGVGPGVAVQNVERSRTSKVSGSRPGIVVVVQRNGKTTCALETVVCDVRPRGRKVGRRYNGQKLFIM